MPLAQTTFAVDVIERSQFHKASSPFSCSSARVVQGREGVVRTGDNQLREAEPAFWYTLKFGGFRGKLGADRIRHCDHKGTSDPSR